MSCLFTFVIGQNKYISDKNIQMFQDALGRLKCLVVDENFNLPQRELANIDTVLKVATSKPELPFGGIHFLGPGGGYQLPPVLATSIFSSPKIGQRVHEKAERGFDLYRQFTCFKELFFNWRQRKSNASDADSGCRICERAWSMSNW